MLHVHRNYFKYIFYSPNSVTVFLTTAVPLQSLSVPYGNPRIIMARNSSLSVFTFQVLLGPSSAMSGGMGLMPPIHR